MASIMKTERRGRKHFANASSGLLPGQCGLFSSRIETDGSGSV